MGSSGIFAAILSPDNRVYGQKSLKRLKRMRL
jgi:hypothetical protein